MKAPVGTLGGETGAEKMQGNNTTGDLFPAAMPTATGPTMPDPANRRAAVLEALRRGERLTHADALNRGWVWRLAADIEALRHDHGWMINTDMIDQGKGRNPIARYSLPTKSEVSQ